MTDKRPAGDGATTASDGLEQLYLQNRSLLLRFLRARAHDAGEAEDLLQELWMRLARQPAGPVGNGVGYLFQAANNLVLDRARERRRRNLRDRLWTEAELGQDTAMGELAAKTPSPVDALVEQEEVRQLQAAIDALPAGARRALLLHKIEDCSHAEIAARLGISRSGVEKHIALAMKHLRRALLG